MPWAMAIATVIGLRLLRMVVPMKFLIMIIMAIVHQVQQVTIRGFDASIIIHEMNTGTLCTARNGRFV